MKKITIEIPLASDENMVITTTGFAGSECQRATKCLEDMGDKISDVKTSEFYKSASKTHTHTENKA